MGGEFELDNRAKGVRRACARTKAFVREHKAALGVAVGAATAAGVAAYLRHLNREIAGLRSEHGELKQRQDSLENDIDFQYERHDELDTYVLEIATEVAYAAEVLEHYTGVDIYENA